MTEEEVMAEVEAVRAVYGNDCQVIGAYPPYIHVHLKPRTADVSSEQFVEAIIGMRAGPQYPEDPPEICVIDSKGLDEQRLKQLIDGLSCRAFELSSCLMLVALCEDAVEKLSSMNHPDGNCPLCLYPLLDEDPGSNSIPFMKLMSCFHCFHCACIIRWWNWIQVQVEKENSNSLSLAPLRMQDQQGVVKMMEGRKGKCPVCRNFFLAKDIEHVLNLVGTGGNMDTDGIDIDRDLVQSDAEKNRREKFEAILKIQQENSGLIEPRKNEVLMPGMFLPHSVSLPSTDSNGSSSEPQNRDPAAKSDTNPGSSFSIPGTRKHNNSNMRRHRTHNSGKQSRHWIKKDNTSEK